MKKLILIFIMLVTSVSLALTPTERTVLEHARTKLSESQKLFESVNLKLTTAEQQIASANQHAAESDARAASAEQNASKARIQAQVTGAAADVLRKQIDVSHTNEQRLGNLVKLMQPIYDQVYKYWGIGAIILGFQILAKHLLILAAVLIGIGLALWIASFFFSPIGVGLKVVRRVVASGITKVATLIHRDKPTS